MSQDRRAPSHRRERAAVPQRATVTVTGRVMVLATSPLLLGLMAVRALESRKVRMWCYGACLVLGCLLCGFAGPQGKSDNGMAATGALLVCVAFPTLVVSLTRWAVESRRLKRQVDAVPAPVPGQPDPVLADILTQARMQASEALELARQNSGLISEQARHLGAYDQMFSALGREEAPPRPRLYVVDDQNSGLGTQPA